MYGCFVLLNYSLCHMFCGSKGRLYLYICAEHHSNFHVIINYANLLTLFESLLMRPLDLAI